LEELQSTEVLDREILEDARRKAFRVLKTADDTVKNNINAWEKKTSQAVEDLKHRFQERRGRASGEIMARLPLDKRRAESEKIDRLVQNALDLWYAAQSRERIIALLEDELRRRMEDCPEFGSAVGMVDAAAFEGKNIKARVYKLSREEGEALIAKILPKGSWEMAEADLSAGGAAGASSTGAGAAIRASGVLSGSYPELVLDSPAVRITSSINLLASDLLADYRSELTSALIGDDNRIITGGRQ
jgi:vacuolar-type H+-ATPase subunit E/Vma4